MFMMRCKIERDLEENTFMGSQHMNLHDIQECETANVFSFCYEYTKAITYDPVLPNYSA